MPGAAVTAAAAVTLVEATGVAATVGWADWGAAFAAGAGATFAAGCGA